MFLGERIFNSPSPSRIKKRDPLAQTAHEKRYLEVSQTKYYLKKRGLYEISSEQISKRIKINMKAELLSWYENLDFDNLPEFPKYEYTSIGQLKPDMNDSRKKAVKYFLFKSMVASLKNDGMMKEL